MSKPLISVGLQFFNDEVTLGAAIRSILLQTCSDWELILHDDGSSDRSRHIALSFKDRRIRLYSDDCNRGRSKRLNDSVRAACGKYYALMDADDVAYPDRLEKQVCFLEANTGIHLVGGSMVVFNENGGAIGKRQFPATHEEICSRPWSGFPMAQPTFMGRRDWFRQHNYTERAFRAQDQDLLIRTYEISRFANLPDIIMGYREKRLRCGRLVKGRLYHTAWLSRHFLCDRRLGMVVMAVSIQALKAAADVVATTTGLNYRLLAHRAVPISMSEREHWRDVYDGVMKATST